MTSDVLPAAIVAARKLECELDGMYFFRYFFKQRTQAKALQNWHHHLICQTLQRVIDGEISRLIINIPPGYTKTELAVVNFMARGLALNPRARFLHASYSDKLALLNSSQTRAIVVSPEFQEMWPIRIRDDTNAKELWWTKQGGGVYATSMKGQVTGFRAGQMEPGFTGALIIDDGLKPDDALTVERGKTNERYNNTMQSRLAHEGVPVIVIMQRVHYDDLSGYLLRGGSGEKWHHLELPIELPSDPYPKENTHAIPIEYEAPKGPLWSYKHALEQIEIIKTKVRLYLTQYKQRPPKGSEAGKLWTDQMIEQARALALRGPRKRTVVAVDPSTTSTEKSDECGIVVAAAIDCGHVEAVDDQFEVIADYTAIMSPDAWAEKAIYAAEIHEADTMVVETNQGGDMVELTLRNAGWRGTVIKVHAKKGKFLRAEPVAPFYKQRRVHHNEGLGDLELEMLDFMIGMPKSPNRVDALVYALTELSNPTGSIGW